MCLRAMLCFRRGGGKKTGYGRCLFNLSSGYFSGFRIFLKESANGVFTPVFAIGRPKGGGVAARSGLAVMAGITNHVSVAWDGKTAQFRVNGLDSSPIPLVADWTPPESLGYAGNRRESVYEFRHGLCAVRIRIAGWNVF